MYIANSIYQSAPGLIRNCEFYSELYSIALRVTGYHGKLANKLNLNDRLLPGTRPIMTTHYMLCTLRESIPRLFSGGGPL